MVKGETLTSYWVRASTINIGNDAVVAINESPTLSNYIIHVSCFMEHVDHSQRIGSMKCNITADHNYDNESLMGSYLWLVKWHRIDNDVDVV